jgi:hypothetical protein
VLGDFEHQALARGDVDGFQGVQDRRQFAGELDVDDGADDLNELAGGGADGGGRLRAAALARRPWAAAAFGGGSLGGGGCGAAAAGGFTAAGLAAAAGALAGVLAMACGSFVRARACVFYVRLLIRGLRRRR